MTSSNCLFLSSGALNSLMNGCMTTVKSSLLLYRPLLICGGKPKKNTLLIVTEVVVRRCITCIFRLAILVIFFASAGKSKRTRIATYQNLFGSLIISDQLCDLIHLVPFLVKTGAEEPV